MSAALPYLSKQRKSDLTELAETSNLPNYSNLKKSDLEIALDDHLRANQTTYASEPVLSDYYKRLGSSSRSPAKRIVDKVTEMVKSDDDAPATKKPRRKTVSPDDTIERSVSALIKTPGKELARKSTALAASIPLPASPADVTNAIDRQTTMLRNSISDVYDRSQIQEYSDYTRELLSSPLTVNILALAIEAYSLWRHLVPGKQAGSLPAFRYVKETKTTVYLPDLFLLLGRSFWAPFTLWSLTSIILPLLIAYFINYPLKASSRHGHGTRRSTAARASPEMLFDPFVYNLAKGLLAYVVYVKHFQMGGIYTNNTIAIVNQAVPGGYVGLFASAGIGGLITLYEAVLKK